MSRPRVARRNLWTRPSLAELDGGAAPEAGASAVGRAAEEISEAGRALRGRLAPVARQVGASVGAGIDRVGASVGAGIDQVGASVGAGIDRVGEALEDPAGALGAELLRRADLPEVGGEAPLASLLIRLDREADLWRGAALRHLERAAWAGRLTVLGGLVALVGELGLAAIGGFRALFGGGELAAGPPVLLGLAAVIVAAGAITAAWVLGRGRQGQLDLAQRALLRADLAEARLHRVAALLELRAAQPERYADALAGLEREMREAG